ncbi:MAG: tetratricopeptide repeat protein [Rhodocyclaceae bacterium]|nr:tetratricopeptide repeat protein [Rhodocyclaceae bacterium]
MNPLRAAKAKSSDDIQTLHQAAMSAFAAGETVVAERYWREAIALSPSFADAHHNFGLLLLQLGRAREAQVEFRKVVELLPQDPGALMNLAVAYKECGDFAAAEAAFRRAMVMLPTSGMQSARPIFAHNSNANGTTVTTMSCD